MKTMMMKRVREAFMDERFAGILPAEVLKKVNQGKIKIVPATVSIRKQIKEASSTHEFIENQTQREIGVTDLDSAKLGENHNQMVTGVKVNIAEAVTGTHLKDMFFSPLISNATDPAIRSAKLQIRQEGSLLFEEKISNLMAHSLPQDMNGNYAFDLEEEFLLIQNSEITGNIVFSPGRAVDNAKEWAIDVQLIGGKTAVV